MRRGFNIGRNLRNAARFFGDYLGFCVDERGNSLRISFDDAEKHLEFIDDEDISATGFNSYLLNRADLLKFLHGDAKVGSPEEAAFASMLHEETYVELSPSFADKIYKLTFKGFVAAKLRLLAEYFATVGESDSVRKALSPQVPYYLVRFAEKYLESIGETYLPYSPQAKFDALYNLDNAAFFFENALGKHVEKAGPFRLVITLDEKDVREDRTMNLKLLNSGGFKYAVRNRKFTMSENIIEITVRSNPDKGYYGVRHAFFMTRDLFEYLAYFLSVGEGAAEREKYYEPLPPRVVKDVETFFEGEARWYVPYDDACRNLPQHTADPA